MIKRLRELLELGNSFAFETTGAGTNYIKYLNQASSSGYEINLVYLWLSSPELAVQRVAQRVAKGGHFIPEDTIRRRYRMGLKNIIENYLPLSHKALILDNSSDTQKLIARKDTQNDFEVLDVKTWQQLHGSANV